MKLDVRFGAVENVAVTVVAVAAADCTDIAVGDVAMNESVLTLDSAANRTLVTMCVPKQLGYFAEI